MSRYQLNRNWLYALAAIIVLLQSFAVWHDVEHPFHSAEAQCERLNAINHLPVADISPELTVSLQTDFIEAEATAYVSLLAITPRFQHAIRAPPVFS